MKRIRASDYNEKRRKQYAINMLNPEYKKKQNDKNKKNGNINWIGSNIDKARERAKKKFLEFDIDKKYISDLYEKQNKKCFWFDLDLLNHLDNMNPLQPSIDRIDSTKGYVKDNVILTCYAANLGRNINDFITFMGCLKTINLYKNDNDLYLEDIRENYDVTCIKSKINWASRLKTRSKDNARNKNISFDLTKEYINELNAKQNGLCYWYGVKMETSLKPAFPLQYSLDRIDSSKGYTKDNVVLCSLMANLGKNKTDPDKWIEFSDLVRNKIKENTEKLTETI